MLPLQILDLLSKLADLVGPLRQLRLDFGLAFLYQIGGHTLPGLPSLYALLNVWKSYIIVQKDTIETHLEDILDGSDETNVVLDQLGEEVVVGRGLVVVNLLDSFVNCRQLGNRSRQSGVLLAPGQDGQGLADVAGARGQVLPVAGQIFGGHMELFQLDIKLLDGLAFFFEPIKKPWLISRLF